MNTSLAQIFYLVIYSCYQKHKRGLGRKQLQPLTFFFPQVYTMITEVLLPNMKSYKISIFDRPVAAFPPQKAIQASLGLYMLDGVQLQKVTPHPQFESSYHHS